MSKKLPFEEAFNRKMNELSLPDEQQSWQQMKRLLEKNKKRRPFAFLLNHRTGIVAAILFIAFAWLIVFYSNRSNKTIAGNKNQSKAKELINENAKQKNKNHLTNSTQLNKGNIPALAANKKVHDEKEKIVTKNNHYILQMKRNKSARKASLQKQIFEEKLSSKIANNENAAINDTAETTSSNNTSQQSLLANNLVDSSSVTKEETILKQPAINNSSPDKAAQKIIFKRHHYYFGDAGIQLKQQLPLSGQKLQSYNYDGNKSILMDYIPTVYAKFEKNNQWFLQGEFNYLSPKFVKPFAYNKTTTPDYAHGIVTTSVYNLQKTFYSQAPLSFNVYLKPDWSVGSGIIFSWFRGATTSNDITIYYAQTNKQTRQTQIVPVKSFTDSFFYKTQTSLLLQTAYEKNKWGFTLRYVNDVQPFLTYTLPSGAIKNKRNNILEFLVRYRLL